MKERIQKLLSRSGVASRRHAELLILQGRVLCNGNPCVLGQLADPDGDVITVDGRPLPSPDRQLYIMLNKPRGYVTTLSDEKGRKNVSQLVSGCGQRVYPVGRLDMESEGLLLLTNDGEFANRLMHPKHQIEKCYLVEVTHYSKQSLELLKKPIVLDGYRIAPPKVRLISEAQDRASIEITICEGRNRQVRRMCARVGMQVKRLVRTGEGSLLLGELPAGSWRYLTDEEVEAFNRE